MTTIVTSIVTDEVGLDQNLYLTAKYGIKVPELYLGPSGSEVLFTPGGGGSGVTSDVIVITGTTGTASIVNTFIGFNSASVGNKIADIPASSGSLGTIIISDLFGNAYNNPISVNQAIIGVDTIYTDFGSLTLLDTSAGWVSL